ncbi:hypothetical protein BN2475_280081 [Paraburkholderia ribeironis]|uniref:Uncharacterized protein n=1 Tax=Paraburkholderia ribeironis TaxID=1247936 RepID=A0A1N7S1I8_9BURK|nr:hypothetical protein BN2475_280081 [Paraburkholderia ribeironis]
MSLNAGIATAFPRRSRQEAMAGTALADWQRVDERRSWYGEAPSACTGPRPLSVSGSGRNRSGNDST